MQIIIIISSSASKKMGLHHLKCKENPLATFGNIF